MIKDESLNRLLNFSDAIVAVAITLLVIPLTDLFKGDTGKTFAAIIDSQNTRLSFLNFIISFTVIFSYWKGHHKIFTNIKSITTNTSRLNELWIFTIVLIPAATQITLSDNYLLSIWLYGGTLIASSFLLRCIKKSIDPTKSIFKSSTLLLLILCPVIASLLPGLGRISYLLLLLTNPLHKYFPKLFEE